MSLNFPTPDDASVILSLPRKRLSDNLVPIRRLPNSPTQGSKSSSENELAEVCDSLVKQVNEKTSELKAARKYADQVTEELQGFVSAVSHDLRTPLRSIRGFSEFLVQEYFAQLDDTAKDYVKRIVGGASRMQTLIDSLTEYSRILSRGTDFENVDLNEVMECVVDLLHDPIKQTSASVSWKNLPTVFGDHRQLTQLVHHLIKNSIQFRGDAAPRIDISASQQDGLWSIEVNDNGTGVEKEHVDAAFDIFRRLGSQPKDDCGTGAGLAICKRIVELHGGAIEMRSEPGAGTSVVFTLASSRPTE